MPAATLLPNRAVDPQSASPLFSVLPAEVLMEIFTYALTPSSKRNTTTTQSNPSESTLYPSTSLPRSPPHPASLLLTSRLTYLYTAHLPALLRTHEFMHRSCPSPSPSRTQSISLSSTPPSSNSLTIPEQTFLASLPPFQIPSIRSIRLVASTAWLAAGGLHAVCALEGMRFVRDLEVEVRYWGWEGWERNAGLGFGCGEEGEEVSNGLSDGEGNGDRDGLGEGQAGQGEGDEDGRVRGLAALPWMTALTAVPDLRTFTLRLSTTTSQLPQLSVLLAPLSHPTSITIPTPSPSPPLSKAPLSSSLPDTPPSPSPTPPPSHAPLPHDKTLTPTDHHNVFTELAIHDGPVEA